MRLMILILAACTDDPAVRTAAPGTSTPWTLPTTSTSSPSTGGTFDTGDTGDTGGTQPGWTEGPARYPADRIQSPITPFIADRLAAVVALDPGLRDDVFMKVGASSTVSDNTLTCFADDDWDLGARSDLLDTLQFFQAGDADGSTPFDRDTEAAESGRTASWAISGDPSPIEEEIAAIDPQLAVVHYGTNDMGMGTTYSSAMPGFYSAMMTLVRDLLDQGIAPVLTGISPRGDSANADRWVATYNAVIRGMAQAWQVPFIDLQLATADLDGYGLSGDGLHLEAYSGGACMLTEEGLEHGYNVRNLIVLDALDRLRAAAADDPLDDAEPPAPGDGSPEDPFEITSLPWSDYRDTAESDHRLIDEYTGCDYDADESGPEYVYRLEIAETKRVRAVVLDEGDVDIDVHLLDESMTAAGCLERDDRDLSATLEPGVYHFVLDTWVSDGEEMSGGYLFAVVTCDDDDDDCG